MKKLKLTSRRDKIELVLYLINVLILIVFPIVITGFLGVSIYAFIYHLTNIAFQCIISMVMCVGIFYFCITHKQLKEIRKKYNLIFFGKKE